MTAIERWKEMIQVEHEQSDRTRGQVPPPADHWTPYAQQFKADPRRTGDMLVDYLQAQVTSSQVVIDVGAGGGRLALPLALSCKLVVAVEPSPSMCRVMREAATEFNVSNVQVVESEWMAADVERVDVTLCSHVLYTIQDIEPFVRKLEYRATELVMVVLFQSPPQTQLYPLWETVHQEPRLGRTPVSGRVLVALLGGLELRLVPVLVLLRVPGHVQGLGIRLALPWIHDKLRSATGIPYALSLVKGHGMLNQMIEPMFLKSY